MTKNQLIMKQNMKRFIFAIIGISIAGILLVFGLFISESVKHKISENIELNENEYYLYINDSRFEEEPINFYEILKSEFNNVIPFIHTSVLINNEFSIITGTDLDKDKILIHNKFYDVVITKYDNPDNHPGILVHDTLIEYKEQTEVIINNINFKINGTFEIIDFNNAVNTQYFMTSYTDYMELDSSFFNNISGIDKFNFTEYYIYSTKGNDSTFSFISDLYNEPLLFTYMDSQTSLFREQSNQFTVFQGISVTFFVMISLFISINIFISINLTIKERKRFYLILSVLGMRLSDLRNMIIREISIISTVSALISFILGIVLAYLVISFQPGLDFIWLNFMESSITFIAILIVPIVHASLVLRFIKYKDITQSDFS